MPVLYDPPWHRTQFADVVLPDAVQNEPAEHELQTDCPMPDAYVPELHETQTDMPDAPANVPAAQFWHAADDCMPVPLPYVPVEQPKHGLLSLVEWREYMGTWMA